MSKPKPPSPPTSDDPVDMLEAQMRLSPEQARQLVVERVREQYPRLRVWYDKTAITVEQYSCRLCGQVIVESSDPEFVKGALESHLMTHAPRILAEKKRQAAKEARATPES